MCEDASRAQELVEGFFTPVAKDELTEDEAELGVDNPDEPGGFKIVHREGDVEWRETHALMLAADSS